MRATESLEALLSSKDDEQLEFTLKGLLRGHLGMLIAAPNVGKSHLALCIGMEHSSSMNLLGFSKAATPQKTLILSAEDGRGIVKRRMAAKLADCPASARKELMANLHFKIDPPPLVIPPESSQEDKADHEKYLGELVTLFSGFDLVIIDTVSEAIGEADEVKHDRIIKNTFSSLAKKSGASILLVHHVNKNEIRGTSDVNVASGAGLTTIMRLTKCLFTMTEDKQKKSMMVKFLKDNYFEECDVPLFPVEIRGNLTVCPDVLNFKKQPQKEIKAAKKPSARQRSILSEPEGIKLSSDEKPVTKSVRRVI